MIYAIIPATREHIESMAARARKADVDELLAAAGKTPAQAMEDGLRISLEAWVGTADGEPFCMFGLASPALLAGSGVPWMVGTVDLDRHAKVFLRHCRPVVAHWAESFDLWNYVDARNTRAVRWLRWLGFTIHPSEPHGLQGLPFHRFDMRCSHV